MDSFARLIDPPRTQLTRDDVDFVLSLHFETPKRYDIFSFAALWNPLQFFHDWGYRPFSRNLLTHDDFLSCSSPWADDHVNRQIARDPMRDRPKLRLYHSLSEPILSPTTGEKRLFYAGINWERVGNKPQRHAELLKLLDGSGDLRIYGPKLFQGVDVWGGYRSYSGPVPFDGVSMVHLIHKAGVSLVLSSSAHRQSELMSSRLFESLAAGAVVICDENRFAHRYFGKSLLYIDSTLGAEQAYEQVQSHLAWVRAEPEKALQLATQAQQIFLNDFSLDRCLSKIYEEFPARRSVLESLYIPKRPEEHISLILLMPEFRPDVLDAHIASVLTQRHVSIRPILAMDGHDFELFGPRIRGILKDLPVPIRVELLEFADRNVNGSIGSRRPIGSVIFHAIRDLVEGDYFCIVDPSEKLFSDHLCSLLRALQDNEQAGCAWSKILLKHENDSGHHADLGSDPGVLPRRAYIPMGFGRFLFRTSTLPQDLDIVLPYLDALPMHFLFGITTAVSTGRCTIINDIQHPSNFERNAVERLEVSREIVEDYAPVLLAQSGYGSGDAVFSPLEFMKAEEKTKIAVELAHSVPVPALLKKMAFGAYRLWLRRHNKRT